MKRLLAIIVAALAVTACVPEPEGVDLNGEPPCTVVSNGKPSCGGADL